MGKVLVILGPTATGKTDLALKLAKKYKGELVACDSRQVYKGLDIGTGKMPSANSKFKIQNSKWIIDEITVWMYDVVDPKLQYNSFDYARDARKVIEDILSRNKLPIIVGGTGHYLKALLEGFNIEAPINTELRKELEQLPLEVLQERLKKLSLNKSDSLNNSDKNNPRRLIRYIEIIMNPYINKSQSSKLKAHDWKLLKIGLTSPRPYLNQRIDLRLNSRIQQGLIKEGERLLKDGVSLDRMRNLGLEYGALAEYLEGMVSKEEMIENLKIKIHQYAKRQETWFKKDNSIIWFDISDSKYINEVENRIKSWYD